MKELLAVLAGAALLLAISIFSPPRYFQPASAISFNRNLYYGLSGDPDVSNLQSFLKIRGFYSGPVSGNFFGLTLNSVKIFQQAYGVLASGFFGPLTRAVANGILKGSPPAAGGSQSPLPQLILNSSGASSADPATEYITLQNNDYGAQRGAAITGLKLKNSENVALAIGGNEYGGAITLNYGESAVVITGPSPLGKNFKIDKCSAYLNQQNNIFPSVYSCPSLSSLILPKNLNSACLNYIGGLGCSVPNINFGTGIDDNCANFVAQHANYAGCAADHGGDSDFDRHEWRIYLGRNSELWGNLHETIQLLDFSGKVIAQTSY